MFYTSLFKATAAKKIEALSLDCFSNLSYAKRASIPASATA
jgi:hypothetical protein